MTENNLWRMLTTILAIDFGGTQVKSALVSEQFAIEKSLPTQSSPQNLEQAIDVIDQIVTSVEVDLSGLAISVTGTVFLRKVRFIRGAY